MPGMSIGTLRSRDQLCRLLMVGLSGLCLTLSTTLYATDHNEPDLLSSFFNDRDGSGADIYGVFAYPSSDKQKLNFIFTLAPVPETGRFDPNSVQRIYFLPSEVVQIPDQAVEQLRNQRERLALQRRNGELASYAKEVKAYLTGIEDKIVSPIWGSINAKLGDALMSNDIPADQQKIPEIRIRHSDDGRWTRILFRNFKIKDEETRGMMPFLQEFGHREYSIDVQSNGVERDPNKIRTVQLDNGIEIFVGGRDDPFFADIGGFFRSINWKAALDQDRNFVWESGRASFRDTERAKESGDDRMKRDIPKALVDRDKNQGLYNGQDWRAGNNVNALVMRIPIRFFGLKPNERLLRIWAESFLTERAYNRINCRKGKKQC